MRALLIVLGIVILIGGLCVTIFSGFAPLFSVAADAVSAMTTTAKNLYLVNKI